MTSTIGAPDRSASGTLPLAFGTRFWEIDAARTVAIVMMVAYHAVYDVELLTPGIGPDPFRGFWGAVPEATGSLFLLVAGASLAVSDGRLKRRGVSAVDRIRRHLRHAAVVLAAATAVTVATRVAFDDRYVRFGILHAIGVSILIAAVTVRLGRWNLLLGGVAVLGGLVISDVQAQSSWLAAIGLDIEGVSSVDHWPLLPWLGPMLAGVGAGAALYPGGLRRPALDPLSSQDRLPRWATVPGRRSLAVYLTHQLVLIPIVWGVLVVAGQDVPWPL